MWFFEINQKGHRRIVIVRIRNGVDVFLEDPASIVDNSKVGLITNPTGVTTDLYSTFDAFYEHPNIDLIAVFGPEHGVSGDVQDALPIKNMIDQDTGIPIFSLYGEVEKPTKEMLEKIEFLFFDIQDVGSRFYTYISTLTFALEASKEIGIKIIVLDRPNPINGITIEGNIPDSGFESFVGLQKVPIRHGFTIGELALLANDRIGAMLEIIPIDGWKREMWFDETGLPWVQPSPNIPTIETATVYPGTCLFEGINISEGRGTTRPFEYIGAPWIERKIWASALNTLGLEGVIFRPCHFIPTFDKYKGEICGGVQLHVIDWEVFKPVETGLHMIATCIDLYDQDFKWRQHQQSDHPHFDLLTGTDKIRKALTEGASVDSIINGWKGSLEKFTERKKSYILYE